MTQEDKEDKELLLRELCARLPYGVIVNTPKGDGHLGGIKLTIFGNEYGVNIKATEREYFNDRECELRPYLRPMSSMTEEEENEYRNIIVCPINRQWDVVDWLNKNMFDYRGLIEKNLALEASEEMYK